MTSLSDGPWPPDVSLLTGDQEATLWFGYVNRQDLDVELRLRRVWHALKSDRLAALEAPSRRSDLVKKIRELLEAADIAESLRTEGLKLIDETVAAHEERNRPVHDPWFFSKDGRLELLERTPLDPRARSRSIDEFKALHHQLMGLSWRADALTSLVLLGPDDGVDLSDPNSFLPGEWRTGAWKKLQGQIVADRPGMMSTAELDTP
jgi:hypothetical protein